MNNAPGNAQRSGIRLVALLLIVGGVSGTTFFWMAETRILAIHNFPFAALYGLYVFLFGWSAWTGYGLWQGKSWALKAAKVIFALQLPIIAIPGFSFDGFSTGLRVFFAVSNRLPALRLGFDLAPGFNITVSPEIGFWRFGINLLALGVLLFLLSVDTPAENQQDGVGLI